MIHNRHIIIVVAQVSVCLHSCKAISGEDNVQLSETLQSTGVEFSITHFNYSFDLLRPDSLYYTQYISVDDYHAGEQINSIHLNLNSLTIQSLNLNKVFDENLWKLIEIPVEKLSTQEKGVSGKVTISFDDIVDLLPVELSIDDLNSGDSFRFQWSVEKNNGLILTEGCETQGLWNPSDTNCFSVIAKHSISDDIFVGNYTLVQQEIAPEGTVIRDFGSGYLFNSPAENEITLELLPGQKSKRNFTATPFAQYEETYSSNYEIHFDQKLVEDRYITLNQNVPTGLRCTEPGIYYGQVFDPELSGFDPDDDSSFEIAIMENSQGDCGREPTAIRFDVIKN